MTVTELKTDDLHATLVVKLEPADYQPQYESTLKNYAKKVSVKGFRPGMVPLPMVKKMYGKALLAEEINKIINDSLHKHITDNKIEILGNPMPKEGADDKFDWDNPSVFEFSYEIGLAPQFNLNLADLTLTYYKISADQKMINQQIEDLTRRHGKLGVGEVSTEKDMILGQFVELNEDGSIKEGGIMHSSTVSVEYLSDEASKKSLVGLKPGDKITVDPRKLSHGPTDLAAMLGVSAEQAAHIGDKFQFTVTEIKTMTPAELNQELFDKLFGEGQVTTEEELKERVAQDLQNKFTADSRYLFQREARITLLNKLNLSLPDDFLKRWIIASNEKPLTMEELNHEYEHYSDDLKWQLIQNKLIKENDLKITNEELIDFTCGYLNETYARYGLPPMDPSILAEQAQRVLQNKDEARRLIDMVTQDKVAKTILEKATVVESEVSYEDFLEKIKEINRLEHAHHSHAQEHEHAH